jgi:FkbM family methyltransferase
MELSLKEIDNIRLYYRPDSHDYSILSEIWFEGYYSKHFPFEKKSVIVDIGGHNGYFAVFSSVNTTSGSFIYAFEPVAENYDILVKNIEINRISNIIAKNMGVSKAGDPLNLFINSAHTGGHSIYKERVEKYKIDVIEEIKIECIAFEKIVPVDIKVIDYCKIDIEGAEFDILLNASQKMLEKVIVYAIEFHEFGGYKADDLICLFKQLNYEVEHGYIPSKRGISYGYIWAIKKLS